MHDRARELGILNDDEYLVGSEVAKRREELGLSRYDLAQKADVASGTIDSIENRKPRKRQPKTVRKILIALGLSSRDDTPTGKTILTPDMTGTWWGYHRTRKKGSRISVIAETEWYIDKSGHCDQRHKLSGFNYSGDAHIEGSNIVITMICESELMNECLVWRSETPPVSENPDLLRGAWFGLDYANRRCGSVAILSREPLSGADAADKLSRIPAFVALPAHQTTAPIEVTQHWDGKQILDQIKNCKDDDQIDMLTTYFPHWEDVAELFTSLKKGVASRQLNFRILLMDYKNDGLVNARFEQREDYPHAKKDNPFCKKIEEQINFFRKLKQKNCDHLNIQIRLYNCWPFGMSFDVAGTVYFGLMTAHASAINGPMFKLNRPNDPTPKLIKDDFNIMWHADSTRKV